MSKKTHVPAWEAKTACVKDRISLGDDTPLGYLLKSILHHQELICQNWANIAWLRGSMDVDCYGCIPRSAANDLRDPSKNVSSKSLILWSFFGGGNSVGYVPSSLPHTLGYTCTLYTTTSPLSMCDCHCKVPTPKAGRQSLRSPVHFLHGKCCNLNVLISIASDCSSTLRIPIENPLFLQIVSIHLTLVGEIVAIAICKFIALGTRRLQQEHSGV